MSQQKFTIPVTDEPVDLVQGIRNHRMITVIKALFWGIDVKLGGITFRLAENIHGGILPVCLVGENKDQVLGQPDLTLEWMSDQAAKMSETEFEMLKVQLSGSIAIAETGQKHPEM